MSDKKTAAIDPEIVRELAAILRDTGLTEIEVEQGETRLRLARMAPPAAAPVAMMAAPAPAMIAPAAAAPEPARGQDYKTHPGAVLSPMVGTAYRSPEPGAKVFVSVGDTVAEGQTVLVVEAMKTFNPIPAHRSGKVVHILVADAQPVEFGEPLVILE